MAKAPNPRNFLNASQELSATRRRPPSVLPVVERTANVLATRKSVPVRSLTLVDLIRTPSMSALHQENTQSQRSATTTKSVSSCPMVRSVSRTTVSVPPMAMSVAVSSLRIAGSPLAKSTLASRARNLFSRRIAVLADAFQAKAFQWKRRLQSSKELQRQTSVWRIRASARRRVTFAALHSPRSACYHRISSTAALARMRPRRKR